MKKRLKNSGGAMWQGRAFTPLKIFLSPNMNDTKKNYIMLYRMVKTDDCLRILPPCRKCFAPSPKTVCTSPPKIFILAPPLACKSLQNFVLVYYTLVSIRMYHYLIFLLELLSQILTFCFITIPSFTDVPQAKAGSKLCFHVYHPPNVQRVLDCQRVAVVLPFLISTLLASFFYVLSW